MNALTRILGLVVAAATILSACSSVGAGPSAPPSTSPSPAGATVDGKTYLSSGIQGGTLVAGTQVRLSFKDGQIGASAGCNSMSGAYTIAGGRLTASQLITTDMGCDAPRMTQDEWLAKLLGGAAITVTGDTLTLEEGPVKLTLLDKEVATPDKPITGTNWVLDGIISGDTASSVPAGVTASIKIVDGHVDVDTGCNTGSGTVEVTGNTLTFGPLTLTKKACEAGPASVEGAVTSVLTAKSVHFTIDADGLTLDAGTSGLTFRATP